MSYQIGFNGAASAELSHLLHAVEGQLNGRGLHLLGQADAQAQTASSTSTGQPCDPLSKDCSGSSSGGHDIVLVVVTAVVAGAAGYVAGKRSSAKVKSPTV